VGGINRMNFLWKAFFILAILSSQVSAQESSPITINNYISKNKPIWFSGTVVFHKNVAFLKLDKPVTAIAERVDSKSFLMKEIWIAPEKFEMDKAHWEGLHVQIQGELIYCNDEEDYRNVLLDLWWPKQVKDFPKSVYSLPTYSVNDKSVTLIGTIQYETLLNCRMNERETISFLSLDQPINVKKGKIEEEDGGKGVDGPLYGINWLQIDTDLKYEREKWKFKTNHVWIIGQLWYPYNCNHHSKVLFSIDNMGDAPIKK
jgi:hypothetical protein